MDQQARNLACTQSQYCISTVKGYRRSNLPHLECDSFHSTEGAIGHYQKVAFASMRLRSEPTGEIHVGGGVLTPQPRRRDLTLPSHFSDPIPFYSLGTE